MDIKVITRHAPSNYGSLLQSIATVTILERLGHTCEIIDYIRDDEHGLKAVTTVLDGKQGWNGNLLKKLAYIALRYPEEKRAEMKFSRMRKKYLKLTGRCRTHEELKQLDADVFMTGSDQVWGPTLNGHYDEAYFLSFVKDKPKIAYAASFGRTEFTPATLSEYKKMLSDYTGIAVRENSAVDLLAQMNIPCAGQVLDPTLLLTGEEWGKWIEKDVQGKYVLVYQLHNNPALSDYAVRFARHVGLPLYRVSPTFHQCRRGGKFVYLPDLSEFLSYIKHSTYFITDSFHGTAFALNFNRQFIEILPNNKTGSRNQSILQLTGLQDRIVTDYNDFSISNKKIDYESVNAVLRNEREKSMSIMHDLCSAHCVKWDVNKA